MYCDLRPAYLFEFVGGVATTGFVKRACLAIAEGPPHQIGYSLDDLPLVGSFGMSLPDAAADLLDVCAAIFLADRLAKRETDDDLRPVQDRWHRRIHLILPLRRPGIWEQTEARSLLESLLGFIADDVWSFEFRRRTLNPRPSEAQAGYVRPVRGRVLVTLNSGGLDSLAGLVQHMVRPTSELIAPVTVVTNNRILDTVQAVVGALRAGRVTGDPEILPVRLNIEIHSGGRPKDDREPSQRARAMLFFAAGASVAALTHADRVLVTENGVGAIGLSMATDHWGARATKAMHPKTLALFSELASIVLDRPLTFQNTALLATKGELMRLLSDDRFAAAARSTASCDRATYLSPKHACGRCSSCILRRTALFAAGVEHKIDGHSVVYETDWMNPSTRMVGEDAIHLFAMRDQVEHLRSAIAAEGFDGLGRAFPELFDIVAIVQTLGLSQDEVERDLTQLFRTYVLEFDALLAKIDRPGWGAKPDIVELTPPFVAAAVG